MTTMIRIAGLALAIATLAPAPRALAQAAVPSPPFEGDGIHVQHLRINVSPSDLRAFDALMGRLVVAAHAARLGTPYHWLCYREGDNRYWLLFFGESASEFAVPATFEGIAAQIGSAEGAMAKTEIMALESMLHYETEWRLVFQQKMSWSTVAEMSTGTHPKARIIERAVRPGKEAAFNQALDAWTAFLFEHEYPLPVEGFALRSGEFGAALQVVFPADWDTYRRSATFGVFASQLDEKAQQKFADLDAALTSTLAGIRHFDGDFASELSYQN